jgi:hypothetical protein
MIYWIIFTIGILAFAIIPLIFFYKNQQKRSMDAYVKAREIQEEIEKSQRMPEYMENILIKLLNENKEKCYKVFTPFSAKNRSDILDLKFYEVKIRFEFDLSECFNGRKKEDEEIIYENYCGKIYEIFINYNKIAKVYKIIPSRIQEVFENIRQELQHKRNIKEINEQIEIHKQENDLETIFLYGTDDRIKIRDKMLKKLDKELGA